MNSWKKEEIVGLLQECGRIALGYINEPCPQTKPDRTIVTDADNAVEQFLTEKLVGHSPDVFLIGEETFRSKSKEYLEQGLHSSTTWIIDPIDGTALYANKIPFWGTSIGFAQNGIIKEGAIIVPGTNEIMISDMGKVYYAQLPDICNLPDLANQLVELSTPKVAFQDTGIVNISQRVAKKGMVNGNNPLQALGSCVYSMILLATGRHMAYVMGSKLWDIAGGLPCLKNLGFHATLPDGQNVLGLRLTSDIYCLNYRSPKAFNMHAQAVCSVSTEINEEVENICGNLEV